MKKVMMLLGMVSAMVVGAADHAGGTEISGDAIISGKTFSGTYEKSVYIVKGGSSVVFENCTFEGVSADADGSCVYIDWEDDDPFGEVRFENCKFINCGNTSYDGGAIYIQNINNTTQSVYFENCVAIGCKAKNGGFMYINDNEAYVSGEDSTIITGCSAEYGGGVYANRLNTFARFILADNIATEDGGGLYDVNTYGEGVVRDCRFYRNAADEEGGGLYVDDSDGFVKGCRFLENTADEDADFYIDDDSTRREYNLSTSDFERRTLEGDGTETNPIRVSDIDDWDTLCHAVKGGKTYENTFIMLTASIVAYNSVGVFNSDSAKKKPFKGSFDGNGRTIILYSFKGSNKAAFGCAVDATVRNLTVNGLIKGGDSLGAIFGNASGSTASNCVNKATIVGSGQSIGGIAGWAGNGSKFINCINNGEVVGADCVGGIVGCEDDAVSVENCHSFGSVTCVRGNAGGITGNVGATSTHELCFYCNEHSPADSCGIGVSHNAIWGGGSETAIELPEAMEEINNYIKTNNKNGWLRVALNRDGKPIFVPNGITDEIGCKVQDISDSEYLYWKFRKLYLVKDNVVSNLNCRMLTYDTGSIGGDEWYVVEGTISRYLREKIDVNGTANLVLLGNSSFTVEGNDDEPGILVTEGNALNIFGVKSGTLTATGGMKGAGIGGGKYQSCGTVNIYGGSVTATGGSDGAGIGGGEHGDGGNVAIYGGSVTAYGGMVPDGVVDSIGNGRGGKNGSLMLGPRVLKIDDNNWKLMDEQLDIEYALPNGTIASTNAFRLGLNGFFIKMSSGWYVVTNEVKIGTIEVCGEANLILADEAKLMVTNGFGVEAGNTLTIYAQSGGSGMLVATGVGNGAGIGGQNLARINGHGNCGNIIINGGVVTAKGDIAGAGIGGGWDGTGGKVTINGGRVTAQGGANGAGIGGGWDGTGGRVTINGGTVTAKGGRDGAGIGGGYWGNGGMVTINGGSVMAQGGTNGAGIGGGCYRAGGTVTINGGSVTAQGGANGAGIGGSWNGADGTVTLDEMKVVVVEGMYGNGHSYVKIVEKSGLICEGGTIELVDGVWVVTPNDGVEAVTIAGLPDGAIIEVPPSVTKVNGVADTQIKIKSGAYDITGAFTVSGGALALNENGSVNGVPVKPTIGDLDAGEPFAVGEGSAAISVRTIPGLKYSLIRGVEIDAITETVVEPTLATGATVTLEDGEPLEGAAFYQVVVSVP